MHLFCPSRAPGVSRKYLGNNNPLEFSIPDAPLTPLSPPVLTRPCIPGCPYMFGSGWGNLAADEPIWSEEGEPLTPCTRNPS